MNKQNWIACLGLSALLAASGCSDDESSSGSGGAGGSGAATGGAAGTSTGGTGGTSTGGTGGGTGGSGGGAAGTSTGGAAGTAGTSTGGAAGTAGTGGTAGTAGSGGAAGTSTGGTAGSAGTAGTAGTAGADAGPRYTANPSSVAVIPTTSANGRRAIAIGTDYATQAEALTFDLVGNAVLGRVTFTDADSVVSVSGDDAFVLERQAGHVSWLDPTGSVKKTIDVALPGSGSSDPITTKAYVTLFGQARVAVVDLDAGVVVRTIDVSGSADPDDHDGGLELGGLTPVASQGRVYFFAGRIDLGTVVAPDYVLPCADQASLVFAIDTATDTLVDLNGSQAGEGIELGVVGPTDLQLDPGDGRLLVVAPGCSETADGGGYVRRHHGIEAIDLASGAVSSVLAPTSSDFVGGFVLLGSSTGLYQSFDEFYTGHWFDWALGGSIGTELTGVPDGATFDGQSALVGISTTYDDAGAHPALVSWNTTTHVATPLSADPWQSGVGYLSSVGVVR